MSTRVENRKCHVALSLLLAALVLFPACSGGGTSGIEPSVPDAEIIITVNPEPPEEDLPPFIPLPFNFFDAYEDKLVVGAINAFGVSAVTTDGGIIAEFWLYLNESQRHFGSGFTLDGVSFQNSIYLPADYGKNAAVVLFKATHSVPDGGGSLGAPPYEIIVEARPENGNWGDYEREDPILIGDDEGSTPEREFDEIAKNPHILPISGFYDTGEDDLGNDAGDGVAGNSEGYAVENTMSTVRGENITFVGYNLEDPANFTLNMRNEAEDKDFPFGLQQVSPVYNPVTARYEFDDEMPPGYGRLVDVCVETNDFPRQMNIHLKIWPVILGFDIPSALALPDPQVVPDVYTYTPHITDIINTNTSDDGSHGTCQGGEAIEIWGGGFLPPRLNLRVAINGVYVIPSSLDAERELLQVQTPGFTGDIPENVEVVVINSEPDKTPPFNFSESNPFTYDPFFASLTPEAAAASTVVEIYGCGFSSPLLVNIQGRDDGFTPISPGSDPPGPGEFFRNSHSVINFGVPDGANDASQNRLVTVTNVNSTSPLLDRTVVNNEFDYLPVITSLSATSGVYDNTIDITGTGFDSDAIVAIVNGEPGVTTPVITNTDANNIQFWVPGGEHDYGQGRALAVTDPTLPGYVAGPELFDYYPACTLLNPTSGRFDDDIIIEGYGFDTDVELQIGSTDVTPVNWQDGNTVGFEVPGELADFGQGRTVTITDPTPGVPPSTSCDFDFEPDMDPLVVNNGSAGATIYVTGRGFDTDIEVLIQDGTGGFPPIAPLRLNSQNLEVTVPCRASDFGQDRLFGVRDQDSLAVSTGPGPLPQIFDYYPSMNPLVVDHGMASARIYVTGCGFDTDAAVLIWNAAPGITVLDEVPGEIIIEDGNNLNFDVPCGIHDYGQGRQIVVRDISVPVDTVLAETFDFDPAIVTMAPLDAIAGVYIDITGCGFDDDIGVLVQNGAPGFTPVNTIRTDSQTLQFGVPCGADDYGQGQEVRARDASEFIADGNDSRDGIGPDPFDYNPVFLTMDPDHGVAEDPVNVIPADLIDITGCGFDTDAIVLVENGPGGLTAVVPIRDVLTYATAMQFPVPGGPDDHGHNRQVSVRDDSLFTQDGNDSRDSIGPDLFEHDPNCHQIVPPIAGSDETPATIQGTGFDELGLAVTIENAAVGGHTYVTTAWNSGRNVQFEIPCGTDDYGIDRVVTITDIYSDASTVDCSFTYDESCESWLATEQAEIGDPVAIDGCGFDAGVPGVTTVTFGNTPAAGVVVSDGTALVATVPDGPDSSADITGTVTVTVDTAYPGDIPPPPPPLYADCSPGDFTYLTSGCSLSTTAAACDTYISITGSGFSNGHYVTFDGIGNPADTTRISSTELQVDVPSGPILTGVVAVEVLKSNGTPSNCGALPAFTIQQSCDAWPGNVEDVVGSDVTITGCGFLDGSVTVTFGNLAAAVTVYDANTIVATVPDGPDVSEINGIVPVTVSGVGPACSPGSFEYAPTCASIMPTAEACDEIVSIYGTGFAPNAVVTFGAVSQTVNYVDSHQLDVTVPRGSGYSGDVAVEVSQAGGDCSTTDFTFLPFIDDVVPADGPATGGPTVRVEGCGFQGASSEVEFGDGNPSTDVSGVGADILNAELPPGLAGGVSVIVTNPGPNEATWSGTFTYTDTKPYIEGISPAEGPEAGGTSVDITGYQLDIADLAVAFGAEDATIVTPGATLTNVLTPRNVGLADPLVDVTARNTATSEYSTLTDEFLYRDRDVNAALGQMYTTMSLYGDYNWVFIGHNFWGDPDATPPDDEDQFVISAAAAVAPISGGVATFNGDGTYDVAASADEFTVTNDGVPNTGLADDVADSGAYSISADGALTMDGYKTGSLAPDGNVLYVASTLAQADRANELYIYTRAGDTTGSISAAADMAMGMVAFVHEYTAAQASEILYSFQGIVDLHADDTFTLTVLAESKNVYSYAGQSMDPTVVSVYAPGSVVSDGTDGNSYSADESGYFQMTFALAAGLPHTQLFDGDIVEGVYSVTDSADPLAAQLFAGVNLSENASNPGRSMLVLMVPLDPLAGKDASSLDIAAGWAQGLFGYKFASALNRFVTGDGSALYDGLSQVDVEVTSASEATDWELNLLSTANFMYDYAVQSQGEFSLTDPTPTSFTLEGFVSEDDSVNVGIETSDAPSNSIRLELTK